MSTTSVDGPKDTYFRRALNFMYGDEALLLQRTVPPEVGRKHVTELLGRHPFHPFDPQMPAEHECSERNAMFGQCMTATQFEGLELHMKHVNCFHPYKVDLMKCLVRSARAQRGNNRL